MNLYLLKYRIKHNDATVKNRIKIILFLVLAIILIPTFVLINPLNKFKYMLENNDVEILPYVNINANNNESFVLPINGTITSNYGYRIDPISGIYSKHTGIDISGIHHDYVRSISNGTVTFAGSQSGYGYCIEIKHSNYYSFYAHLSRIKVNVGDTINKGDVIGIEGGDPYSDPNPGYSTGHHLHFEIRTASGYGNDINPINYINKTI